MDFFALKHKYRQSSRLFYALFFLVVLVQSLLLMAMVGAVFGLWAGHLGANVLIISGVFVGLYFVMGMLIARHKTKQGGLSLAKAVGATRLFVHGDIPMVIDDKTLIEMCHQVRAFGVADLAVVVMNVDGNSAMIETLKTAFLFDGDMSQDEYEVVLLASLLWQK